MKRRSILIIAAAVILSSCGKMGISSFPTVSGSNESFSIVGLPDSQGYLAYESKNYMFSDQIEWIIENKTEENIVFVFHEGDIISSNSQPGVSEPEWEFAAETMNRLSAAGISYAAVPGNHDYTSGHESSMYNTYFPLTSFSSMETFGGTFEEGYSDNTWHGFWAGGISVLFFALEFGPREAVLDWANDVASEYPESAVMAVTHGYLDEDGNVLGPGDNHDPMNGYGITDGNSGTDMWDKLFSRQENMWFVFCGHTGTSDDGSAFLESPNNAGLPVYQLLANWQNFTFSNSGYLRIMTFDPVDRTVRVRTYSPSLNIYLEDTENDITLYNQRFF